MFDDVTISATIERIDNRDKLVFSNGDIKLAYFEMDYIIEFFRLNSYSLERIEDERKEV